MKTDLPEYAMPDEFKDLFEELSAILEHDAQLGRRQAENTALRMIYAIHNRQTFHNDSA
jgi:hypothetical protein